MIDSLMFARNPTFNALTYLGRKQEIGSAISKTMQTWDRCGTTAQHILTATMQEWRVGKEGKMYAITLNAQCHMIGFFSL